MLKIMKNTKIKPQCTLHPKLVVIEYFIPNFKHKSTVYLKLNTPIYCIPKNPGRPWLFRGS